jgi:hypothetical protein
LTATSIFVSLVARLIVAVRIDMPIARIAGHAILTVRSLAASVRQ